jgi:hypothetical protein
MKISTEDSLNNVVLDNDEIEYVKYIQTNLRALIEACEQNGGFIANRHMQLFGFEVEILKKIL